MTTPNIDTIIDEAYSGLVKTKPADGAFRAQPVDTAIDLATHEITAPGFQMPEPVAPAAPVEPAAEPSMLDKLKAGAGALASDVSDAIESAWNTINIPQGAQVLFDFMNPSLAISKKVGEKLQDPGNRAGVQNFVYGLPGTAKDIIAEVPAAVAMASMGAIKGATLGAVDLAQQQFGIPFTTIKTAPSSRPLPDMLKELGVSPEVADSQIIPKIGEAVGSIAAWQGIASAMNVILPSSLFRFGASAKALAGEGDLAPVTKSIFGDLLPEAVKQGATGAIMGGGRVRGPDENMETNALYGAALGVGGAIIGEGANAIARVVGKAKMVPFVELKNEVAHHLYQTGAVSTMEEAERQASRVVVKIVGEAGGLDKVPTNLIKEATARVRAARAGAAIEPLAPEGAVTPGTPPTRAALPEGASAPKTPPNAPEPIPGAPTPQPGPIAPPAPSGAATQPVELPKVPLESGLPPHALGPVPADPAMLRNHVEHLGQLIQTADPETRSVIVDQFNVANKLLVAFQDQAKETVFHAPSSKKNPAGAGIEVVQYNDGHWEVRTEATTSVSGFSGPFHGGYDSKEEATTAGISEVNGWIDEQLARSDTSAANKTRLEKLKVDLKGKESIVEPEPKRPSPPPAEEPKEVVRGQVKTTKQPKPVDPIKGLNNVINRRSTLPILSAVHVQDGQVTATDLETALTLKSTHPDGIYQIVGSNLEKTAMDPKDFPAMPAMGKPAGSLDRGEFLSNLERISRFASTDPTRYVLQGPALKVEGGKAELAATNGRVLSESDVLMPTPIPDGTYILGSNPKKLISALKALEGDTLRVHLSGEVIQFVGDNGHVAQRIIQGSYPNIEQVRPTLNTVAYASRDEVAKAFAELKPYIKAGKNDSVRLEITDSTLRITTQSISKNETEQPIKKEVAIPITVQRNLSARPRRGTIVMPMKLKPGETGTAVSHIYLENAIKSIGGDKFYFGQSDDPLKPMHFFGSDPTLPKNQEAAKPTAKPKKGKKAPSGAASVGEFADIEVPPTPPPAPTADRMTDELPPVIELPELVQISKDLLGGQLPEVFKNLRVGSGEAFGVFRHGEGEGSTGKIGLRADIFAGDGVQAVKTLAHEIGHLIDWLPDKTIARGNVLGHLLALKKYMAGTYSDLYNAAEIRTELKNMTQVWKPFDPKADSNYTAYRYRSSELYADAISVLFNNPALLRQTAPKFYRGWFEELDRRPEVKKVYEDTVRAFKNGGILRTRDENLQAMYQAGEARAAAERGAAAVQYRNMVENLRFELIDRNEAIIKRVGAAGAIDPADNPIYALEEMNYSSSEAKAWMTSYDGILSSLKDNELTWQQLGDMLFHERVIGDPTRAEQANPLGFTPRTSAAQLKFMAESFGEKRFGALRQAADAYRSNWQYVVKRLEESRMLDAATIEKIKSNPYYVTFDVFEKHITSAYGPSASPRIFKSVGTLKEITNPATATLMKGISMIKAINRNTAAVKVVNFLSQNFGPNEVRPADTEWNGRARVAIEPKEAHKGMITLMEGGKLHSFYVDEYVAKSFNRNPQESRAIIDVLAYTNQFFRSVFVQKNPGFQLFNLIRDFKRAYKNIPGMTATDLLKYYGRNMSTAYRKALGITDPIVQEMLEKKMLITVETKWGLIKEDEQIAALVARYNASETESKNVLWRPFQKIFRRLGEIGEAVEFLPKVAGYQYLREHQKELGISDEVLGHMIRGQIGSPDFLRQGGGYSVYNQIFLFSNSIKEGWRSDVEVVKERPAEYLWKTAKLNFMPKLLMYAGSIGLMGLGVKKMFDNISEYDKTNYLCIPLGLTSTDKTVYLRLPVDEVGRFLGGLMWKGINQSKNRDIADLFSFMGGQAPSLTPSIQIPFTILQFMSGQNPYDFFRGRNAMPDTVFQAKDWHTLKEFTKYLSNMGGLGLIHRFDTNKINPVKSDLEKIVGMPIMDNIVGRFIKVSDYGSYEDAKQVVESQRTQEARMRLNEQDALADHINANEKPDITKMVQLYYDMRKEGLLSRGVQPVSLAEFKKTYDKASEKKTGDIYADAMVFLAKTTPEKAALLAHYQLSLTKEKYDEVFNHLLTMREIGPEVMMLADRIREGTK